MNLKRSVDRFNGAFILWGKRALLNPKKSGLEVLALARDGLEPLLRRLVASQSRFNNVTFRQGTVTSLELSSDESNGTRHKTVTGVRVRDPSGKHEETLPVTCAIDASGPTCLGVRMLARLSTPITVAHPSDYDPGVVYKTALFSVSLATKTSLEASGIVAEWVNPWMPAMLCVAGADFRNGLRFGAIVGIMEGSRVILNLTYAKNDPDLDSVPSTGQDFAEMLQGLPGIPLWIKKLTTALVDSWGSEHPDKELSMVRLDTGWSHWYDYAAASSGDSYPSNFIALGDAVMKLNPIYASGGTKAACDAVTLDASLRHSWPSESEATDVLFARKFFQRQRPRIHGFWLLPKSQDYAQSCHTAATDDTWLSVNIGYPLFRAVFSFIYTGVSKNEAVAEQFFSVMMMVAPPLQLFAPWVLLTTARHLLVG